MVVERPSRIPEPAYIQAATSSFMRSSMILPPRSTLFLNLAWLMCAWTHLAACETAGVQLSIDVQTGLVPGPEFERVETTLYRTARGRYEPNEVDRIITTDVRFPDRFERGRRVAEFGGLTPGTRSVRVRLYRPESQGGVLLIERWVRVKFSSSQALLIRLDRECVATTCPSPGGSPAFSECLAGRCVDPECDISDPATYADHCCDSQAPSADCPNILYCNDASECAAVSACARASCIQGACVETPMPDTCEGTEWCDPNPSSGGCRPLMSISDAGAFDAGPREEDSGLEIDLGSVVDAGIDAGDFDAGFDAGLPVDAGIDAGDFDAGFDAGPDAGPLCDASSAADAATTLDPRLGCLGSWSSEILCASGQECRFGPNACVASPSPGAGTSGSSCTSRTDCASTICTRTWDSPSRACRSACERNADCELGTTCALEDFSFDGAPRRRCVPTSPCAGCSGPDDYCDQELARFGGGGGCVHACRLTGDCPSGDCAIRNGSSLTPFCTSEAARCRPDELRIDTDSGRRQGCVRLDPCLDDSQCDACSVCVQAAYGGITQPVGFCGRLLGP
jgi:hypothetical protein